MSSLADAFWRAAAYCLHPRVIVLSLAPLLIAGGLVALLGWLYWESALDAVRATLEGWALVDALLRWSEHVLGADVRTLIVPLVVVMLAVPAVVLLSLLLVAWLMTPALVSLVARRRFAGLEEKHGAAWWQSVLWSLGAVAVALALLVVSLPLWFIPPLVLVVPPLIWGWLTCRVMAFDVLAVHADPQERRVILRAHRWPLLAIGVIAGALGAAPGALWAVGAPVWLPFAPILVPLSVWLYTLVFAFSALWFAHYALAALHTLRARENAAT
jgi:hypothetical protein